MNAQQDTLYYIGDPMCSWCYGFAPEVTQIQNELHDEIPVEIVLGGLRPNGTQTMAELGDFLKEHWDEIEELTGQIFQHDILQQKEFIYNTEPACRAVVVVRQIDATKTLEFYKAVQTAFYRYNEDVHSIDTYLDIAQQMEIDTAQFRTLYESDAMKMATELDFGIAQQMGIRGFPSLVLKKGDEYHLISNGYQKASVILEKINSL